MAPNHDNPFASGGTAATNDTAVHSGGDGFRSPHPLMTSPPPPPQAQSSSGQNFDQSHMTTATSHLFVSPNEPMYTNTPHSAATRTTFARPSTMTTPRSTTDVSLAQSARNDFKKHGSGVTQSLEEIRRKDENRPGTLTARLVSAEERRDVAGKRYTAYVVHVKLPNTVELQLEHRYSEFAKLHDVLKSHGIHLVEGGHHSGHNGGGSSGRGGNVVVFPKKHLAGRIGNWTPSLKWAPEQHDELVQYRKIQLDVWLTHVCERYNLGDLPHSVGHAVLEFLTLSDRPPCEYENPVDGILGENEDDTVQSINGGGNNNRSGSSSTPRGKGSSGGGIRWNNPISFTLGSSIRQACHIVDEMCAPRRGPLKESDQSIPLDLLHHAKGLVFLTVIKAGLVVSGRVGTGLLLARIDGPQSWSAPCALGTMVRIGDGNFCFLADIFVFNQE
jgi:hypothetical protein